MSSSDRDHWDSRYERRIDEGRMPAPDPLLLQFAPPVEDGTSRRALDLAAGLGQNALWLAEQGYTVDRRKIQLAQPIKELGTFAIAVKLPREVAASVSVHVVKKLEAEPPASE